ncbi:MAG: vanadium-dependent haloperoxidase, partial [Verrucomicrobiota bacterium]
AGLAFDLEGPDSQAVTMPPAPALGSDLLTLEMAEVYTCALLRDTSFEDLSNPKVALTELKNLKSLADKLDLSALSSIEVEKLESRLRLRGVLFGDDIGPYISQFLLAGNKGINRNDDALSPAEGFVTYGGIRVDQRVRVAEKGIDFMQSWEEWYDVQNGADFRRHEIYSTEPEKYRFIETPRDLATYVHYDALYEAYLNACLYMLAENFPFDPGIPFQKDDAMDHQQGFALFGGPHILSLVTEVATRALKAVRYQKFNIHRRLRPEALAARVHREPILAALAPEITEMKELLDGRNGSILKAIDNKNPGTNNYLLPMAFPEGSPMHPAYGAGHATVAGACVTILKAFFDHTHVLDVTGQGADKCFVAGRNTKNNSVLKSVAVKDLKGNASQLTVEGELNKLASNISIGRDWAGVHYYSDYLESVRMGEQIAIGILEEQMLTYGEEFSMTIPLFDGGFKKIK